jgi:hypothetical protein
MIVRLSRVMNRARQDAITTEIMEIVGGAEALRQGGNEDTDLLVEHAFAIDPLNPTLEAWHKPHPHHDSSKEQA